MRSVQKISRWNCQQVLPSLTLLVILLLSPLPSAKAFVQHTQHSHNTFSITKLKEKHSDNTCSKEDNFEKGLMNHNNEESIDSSSRRRFLTSFTIASSTIMGALTSGVSPSYAGEVGARINKAITQSDLGISVRRSVVKGAQLMDKLDGDWEKFSDVNNLGTERSKRDARPKPYQIPNPLPLNINVARAVLQASDETFLSIATKNVDDRIVNSDILDEQIQRVNNLVKKSFERGGLVFPSSSLSLSSPSSLPDDADMSASLFNYYCYIHFKAYCDLLIEKKIPFNRKQFETLLGNKLLPIFLPDETSNTLLSMTSQSNTSNKEDALQKGFTLTDEIISNMKRYGFISLAERSDIDKENIEDWSKDLSDLSLSIPIDGDITLSCQVLLQEQGLRIYPDFGRFAITAGLERSLAGQNQVVNSDEYYMDTNYNSDPNLFEVKQVLLNIVIDSV